MGQCIRERCDGDTKPSRLVWRRNIKLQMCRVSFENMVVMVVGEKASAPVTE